MPYGAVVSQQTSAGILAIFIGLFVIVGRGRRIHAWKRSTREGNSPKWVRWHVRWEELTAVPLGILLIVCGIALGGLNLPKEVLASILQGANKSKEDFLNKVGNETIKLLSKIDFVKEASRFVEEHKFRINAEIEVIKRDKTEPKS